MSRSDNEGRRVQVIRRAAQILDVLKEHPDGMSLSQIADRTGLARSTVHRLLAAMATEGLLASVSPNGRFRPGPAIATLAAAAERNFVLEFHPTMAKLSRALNETVDLAVLEYDPIGSYIKLRRHSGCVRSPRLEPCSRRTAPPTGGRCSRKDEEVRRVLPERLDQLTRTRSPTATSYWPSWRRSRDPTCLRPRGARAWDLRRGTALLDADKRAVAMTVPMPAHRFYGNEESIAKVLLDARRAFERSTRAGSTAGSGNYARGRPRRSEPAGRPPARP